MEHCLREHYIQMVVGLLQLGQVRQLIATNVHSPDRSSFRRTEPLKRVPVKLEQLAGRPPSAKQIRRAAGKRKRKRSRTWPSNVKRSNHIKGTSGTPAAMKMATLQKTRS